MGPHWVRQRESEPPPGEGQVRFRVLATDASSGDGFALVQESRDTPEECEERYFWLVRTALACAPDELEVRPAATDCCGPIPCPVDARVLTFRLISAISDRDLPALRGLLPPRAPLRAIVGDNVASFTRATLTESAFHALGDWSWARGALPPPHACGGGDRRQKPIRHRCEAWAGGARWRLTWETDRLGTFLVEMRALVP